jgi:preprotein translocase subunit SecG
VANVLIVAYLLIVLALIAVILLQRSEGGGLGMGGNPSPFMTARSSANVLTRTTAVLAALFFATAIGLTILTEIDRGTNSILQRAADSVGEGGGTPTSVLDALNQMNSDSSLPVPDGGTTAPATDGAAVPATDTTAPAGNASDVGGGATNPAADPGLAVPSTSETPSATTTTTESPAATGTPAPSDSGSTSAPATDQPAGDTTTPAAPVN